MKKLEQKIIDAKLNDNNSSSNAMSKSLVMRLGINDGLVAELDTIRSQMKQIINAMKKHTLLVSVHAVAAVTVSMTSGFANIATFDYITCIMIQTLSIFGMFSFATKCSAVNCNCLACSLRFVKNDNISEVKTVVVQPSEP